MTGMQKQSLRRHRRPTEEGVWGGADQFSTPPTDVALKWMLVGFIVEKKMTLSLAWIGAKCWEMRRFGPQKRASPQTQSK